MIRAYSSTLKFQRGETGGRASAGIRVCPGQGITSTSPQAHARFLELRIPVLPEESCAVALAEFLLRFHTTTQLPINFLLSAVLATLMSYVYWLTLKPLGRLLEQREIRILSAVTAEVE